MSLSVKICALVLLSCLVSVFSGRVVAETRYKIALIKRGRFSSCISDSFSKYTNGLASIKIEQGFVHNRIAATESLISRRPDMVVLGDLFRRNHGILEALSAAGIPVISRDGIAPSQVGKDGGLTVSLSDLYALQGNAIRLFVKNTEKYKNKGTVCVYLVTSQTYEFAKRLREEIKHSFAVHYNRRVVIVDVPYSSDVDLPKINDGDVVVSLLPSPSSAMFYQRLGAIGKKIKLVFPDILQTDDSFEELLLSVEDNVELYSVNAVNPGVTDPYGNYMSKYCPNVKRTKRDRGTFEELNMAYLALKSNQLKGRNLINVLNDIQYISSYQKEPYHFNSDGISTSKVMVVRYDADCDCKQKGKPHCPCHCAHCHCPKCKEKKAEDLKIKKAEALKIQKAGVIRGVLATND